ncbi:hypothetical protein [Phreatobacter stygius]|uniref:Uncharacterized protein n=1 Tax=Phreatobacter stygius TaxID=1940610 RepID=A0A4D7BBK9_9HYPH|nr:hypothetical protein [Phreatobacter stygius]QCI68135.1 hypothetical protein E8M01_30225 [Phreatobacter stygius]
MKKLLLAATLLAPFAIIAPALADDTLAGTADAYILQAPDAPAATLAQYRSRAGMGWSDRESVPSSAFNSGT